MIHKKVGKKLNRKKGKVSKIVRNYVHKAIDRGIEQKYIDTFGIPNVTNGTPVFALLNGMVQGSAENNRIADKVRIKEIRVIADVVTAQGSAVAIEYNLRFLIVWDKQPNGAIFAFGGNAGLFNPATVNYDATLNYNTDTVPNRYHVLYDKIVQPTIVTTGATPLNATTSKGVTIHKRVKVNKLTQYGLGNAGTIADINTGSCYLLLCSNSLNNMVCRYQIKLIYEDA